MPKVRAFRSLSAVMALLCLVSCGGGSGVGVNGGNNGPSQTAAPTLTISAGLKQLQLSWLPVADATSYRVMVNPDGQSNFTEVGTDLPPIQTSIDLDIAVHKIDWPNAVYLVAACNLGGCTNSNQVSIASSALAAIGYFKASNTAAGDQFGYAVAVSGDGTTMAVGAPFEPSNAIGVNDISAESHTSAHNAGAVYVFTRSNGASGVWTQQAYIKESPTTEEGDEFGFALALSSDGNTLAVGAPLQNGTTDSTPQAGAVYIYTRSGSNWSPAPLPLQATTPGSGYQFGYAVALNTNGTTLAVGSPYAQSSPGTGNIYGAAYVFTFDPTTSTWTAASSNPFLPTNFNFTLPTTTNNAESYTQSGDEFGYAIALSNDGSTLAVGSPDNDGSVQSQTQGIGAVYVYAFTSKNLTWTPQAYLTAINLAYLTGVPPFHFGSALALSANGDVLAVGSPGEDTSFTGVIAASNVSDLTASDNSPGVTLSPATNAGAAYIYTRNSSNLWSGNAYVKASNTASGYQFGSALALSADGSTLVVGSPFENSSAQGVSGAPPFGEPPPEDTTETNAGALSAGAAYVYTQDTSGTWSQLTYVKASNTNPNIEAEFGFALALSTDGNTLVAGAPMEASNALGVGGDQANTSDAEAGAAYLY